MLRDPRLIVVIIVWSKYFTQKQKTRKNITEVSCLAFSISNENEFKVFIGSRNFATITYTNKARMK